MSSTLPVTSDTYKDRVKQERAELAGKLGKLVRFISSGNPSGMLLHDWMLLLNQRAVMQTYLDILDTRLRSWGIDPGD